MSSDVDRTTPPLPPLPDRKKRGRETSPVPPADPLLAAALQQAGRICQSVGLLGLASLLMPSESGSSSATSSSNLSNSGTIPTPEQVQAAATKAYTDQPPWVHWSKTDMASAAAFRVTDNHRLALTGAFRGYRMARASHGVASGNYYYECWIQPGPTATEIVQNLPTNARLGPQLQKALEAALAAESNSNTTTTTSTSTTANPDGIPAVGGNVRFGWSMRTGDLHAPVGYDKWSYAYRDGGGIVHQSIRRREDDDAFAAFGPGDVVGAAVCLGADEPAENHIRFFRNGECGGDFVVIKGKRSGGEAFTHLVSGTYYPAVSTYLAGSVVANFGPKFVYPPRKLPPGLKLAPLSDLAPPPPDLETVLAELQPVLRQLRKDEQRTALQQAVAAEVKLLVEIYDSYGKQHLRDIKKARMERGLSVADFPDDDDEKGEKDTGDSD